MNYLVFLCFIFVGFYPLGVEIWPGVTTQYASDFTELPVRSVRTYIRWNEVESTKGVYSWNTKMDADMQFLSSKQVSPIIVSIHDTPKFFMRLGETRSCAQPDELYMAEFAAFVRAASIHYPQVTVWEFWNEPEFSNGQDGYYGCWGSFGGETYGRFLRKFYDAIKSVDQKDLVMFGSMGSINIEFIRQARQQATWDVTGIHIYVDENKSFDEVYNSTHDWVDQLNSVYDRPVWITETSFISNTTSPEVEQKQVDWLNYLIDNFSQEYHVIIWYSLADPEWRNAGMYEGSKRKSIWYEFQEIK